MNVDLCRPCMEAWKAQDVKLKPLVVGVDRKVMCANCKRRRYGGTYIVQSREKGGRR